MKLNPRIRKELERRADGVPRDLAMWRAYIRFLEACPALPEYTPKTTVHHVLWRSEYPKHIKSKWNLIRLSHENHVAAAALMLAANPNNRRLRSGFYATYKIVGGCRRWAPTDSEEKEIIKLYQIARWSTNKIAKKYGVSFGCVLNFLKRNFIPIYSRGDYRRWTPELVATVIHLYVDKKLSLIKIGKRFGVGGGVIHKILCRSKVSCRTRQQAGWNKIKAAHRSEYIVKQYEREGQTLTKIAKKLNTCLPVIRRILVQNKIFIRHNKVRWFPKNAKEIIIFYKEGRSADKIGKKCGVSRKAVFNFLLRNNIKIRTLSEAQTLRHAQQRQMKKVM